MALKLHLFTFFIFLAQYWVHREQLLCQQHHHMILVALSCKKLATLAPRDITTVPSWDRQVRKVGTRSSILMIF